MSRYNTQLRGTTWTFDDLKNVLAKATPERNGDCLARVGATSARERVAAQTVSSDLPLTVFLKELVVPYESDEVSRLIVDTHDPAAFAPLNGLTVGQSREWLLRYETTMDALRELSPGLTPEMVAAVSKICRNPDLISKWPATRSRTLSRNHSVEVSAACR